MQAFMEEVHCSTCGRPTRHLDSTLGRIVQLQSVSNEAGKWINYACPLCNSVTRSLVAPVVKIFDRVDLSKFPDDVIEFGVSLECAKSGCESPVILLAPMRRDIGEDRYLEYMQKNWTTQGAACLKGSVPLYPFEVRVMTDLLKNREPLTYFECSVPNCPGRCPVSHFAAGERVACMACRREFVLTKDEAEAAHRKYLADLAL